MNILQLVTRRQYRGAEVFASQLSEQLLRRGHSVIFTGLYPAPPEALSPAGMANLDLNGHRRGIFLNPSLLRQIAKIVEAEKVDIVQANTSDNLKYAVLSRKIFGWKAPVIYRNGSVLSHWTRSLVHRRVNRWLLNQCEAVACISRETMRDLRDEVGVQPERLHLLSNGTPFPHKVNKSESLAYLKEWVPLAGKEQILVHIGSFTAEKNHRTLIRAFEMIQKELSSRLILLLIGDGPLRPQIEGNVRKRGLEKQILFLGQRNDIPRLLPAADLLLLPSQVEGIPAVLLEASAQKVVSVAYRVGGVSECFPESLHGQLIVEKNDVEAMVQKAIHLLTHPDERRTIAAQLQQFVKEHYSLEKISEEFEILYYQILDLQKELHSDE